MSDPQGFQFVQLLFRVAGNHDFSLKVTFF